MGAESLVLLALLLQRCKPVAMDALPSFKVRPDGTCPYRGDVIQLAHFTFGKHPDGRKWCRYVPDVCVDAPARSGQ